MQGTYNQPLLLDALELILTTEKYGDGGFEDRHTNAHPSLYSRLKGQLECVMAFLTNMSKAWLSCSTL